MSRTQKIAKLKQTKARKAPESLGDYALLADAMEAIVADFKQSLKRGVDITDLDVLLDRLEGIGELKTSVDELKAAVAGFPELPSEVKIASVNEFLDAIKGIEIKAGDVTVTGKDAPDYSPAVIKLAKAVEGMAVSIAKAAPKSPSQRGADYVPYRRVIKKGNSFIFDDQPTPEAGGGGGSTTPSRKDASGNVYVPVANADGSTIGGSGAITNDGTFARFLVNIAYDDIQRTYPDPSPTTEVYKYYSLAVQVAEVTVTYQDTDHTIFLRAQRTA